MKKTHFLSTVAIAAMLITSMLLSTPAFAASRTTTTEVTGTGRTADDAAAQVLGAARATASGEGVTAGIITDKAAIDGLKNLEAITNLINTVATNAVASSNLSIVDSMELTVAPGVEVSEENPLFVSFSFPGITASTRAYVLHFTKGAWEVVPTTIKDGKVIGKFTSFSPVAIVVETNTLNSSVLGANRKSPRTGDNSMFIVAACAGVLLAGSIFAQKKLAA